MTVQVHRVYIKATPEAIWDAITKPEWTERYGYAARVEYDLRPGGAGTAGDELFDEASLSLPDVEAPPAPRVDRPPTLPSGMPPGQVEDASRNWRVLSTRRWTSSKPSVCTTHFMRARSLLSRLP